MMRWSIALWLAAAAAFVCACDSSPSDANYCTPDETMCHGSCSALYKDPANCGACDNACAATLVCSQGTCATSCGGGTTQCGQSCIEVSVDPQNCGGCGMMCGSGDYCADGQCTSTCAPTQHLCLNGGAAYCANLGSDNQNCGACGLWCGTGEACINGACTLQCGPYQTPCTPMNVTPYCSDLTTDINNCGTCGNTCPFGGYCLDYACGCPAGYSVCSTSCVDQSTDAMNCGGCGTICSGTCSSGRCAVSIYTLSYSGGPLALDSTNAYAVDTGDELVKAAKAGGKKKVLSTFASVESLAVDSSYAYWPNGGEVDYVPIDGGTMSSTLMPSSIDANEVVADGTSVYVAHDAGIVSFPSGGGTVSPLVSNEDDPHSLTVQGSYLYWADDDYTLRSSGTDGSGLKTIATMASAIDVVVADSVNVYFTESEDEILAIPANGSGPPVVLISGLTGPLELATDGVSVYWIDATTISKVPVTGGAATTLYSTGGDAAYIAVDGTSVFWTNSWEILKLTPK